MSLCRDHFIAASDFTALSRLRSDAGINLVMIENAISPTTRLYMDGLDLDILKAKALASNAKAGDHLVFPHAFENADYQFEKFAAILPDTKGRDSFFKDIEKISAAFATIAPRGIVGHFSIVTPVAEAGYHHDNDTDIRGLITLKGTGTYWIPDADLLQTLGRPVKPNFYGQFTKSFLDTRRLMPTGSFAAWKGERHANPLIHSEPAINASPQKRLHLLLNMN